MNGVEGGDEPAEADAAGAPADTTEPGDREMPVVAASSSGWEINWTGATSVLLVAVALVLLWSLTGGGSAGDTDDADERTTVTTAPVTAATTTLPPTTTTTTSTTVPERRVVISGEVKPCRFGDRCLVASFVIEGFDEHPGRYVCIYPNSQSDFGFNDNDVDDACFTGDVTDTIAIEVDGVRSATISEDDLDG